MGDIRSRHKLWVPNRGHRRFIRPFATRRDHIPRVVVFQHSCAIPTSDLTDRNASIPRGLEAGVHVFMVQLQCMSSSFCRLAIGFQTLLQRDCGRLLSTESMWGPSTARTCTVRFSLHLWMANGLRHNWFSAREQECPVQREHSTLRCCGSETHFSATRLLLSSVNRVRRQCTAAAFSDATMHL